MRRFVITLLFCFLTLSLAAQEDTERERARKYLQVPTSSQFGPCGNRKENIDKYGPENPYVQLSPKDFRTIKQWGKLALSEPREMFGHQYLASSTVADVAILHGRGVHQLDTAELAECRGELFKMLKANDSNIRGHALKGLAAVGEPRDLFQIEKSLKDENPRVRIFAKEAIAAIDEREKKAWRAMHAARQAAEEEP